jgi:hypothetical protein
MEKSTNTYFIIENLRTQYQKLIEQTVNNTVVEPILINIYKHSTQQL